MSYTKVEIEEKFGARLVGKRVTKRFVIEALQLLPDEVVDFVTKNVWFVSSFEDAWGFVLTGEELQGKQLIFLSDDLFGESEKQIRYTILHEVGHVILKHRNAILQSQTKLESQKQEMEADSFAKKFLKIN
ncbi:MAG TPA: ImmA/IrrE family metallo-endopeptidase [Candidatus Saccharimonadales bacterium]|nr:ImmA/IrrE family metallo-endopeptidase [Candidatus Saccharimonadales bacterium]